MAENSPLQATPNSGQNSSGDTQKAMSQHEGSGIGPSSNDTTSAHPAKAEPNVQQNGTSTPSTDSATKTTDQRAYNVPKFSTSTEKEIRDLMNSVRLGPVHEGDTITVKDFRNLGLLTTNLVQLMNAEYIAKDTIVRAIAYMRGESQLPPRRALGQAQRDRRAARHNQNGGHSGYKPQDKSEQGNSGTSHATGTSPVENGNHKEPEQASTYLSSAGFKPEALSSGPGHNDKTARNGTSSEKDNNAPAGDAQTNKAGAFAAKEKKKRYWKARRQAGKRIVYDSHSKNSAIPTVEDGAEVTIKDGEVVTVKNGEGAAVKKDTGVPVETGNESNSNTTEKAKSSDGKTGSADQEAPEDVSVQA
ncbi:hypothetical protein A1O1_07067 [Capronia coronata CBS 617.96]|uniref:Uncharacterized protein n=1 Tax=Capronia coronata CBS 617.96 TaxID=1182541 RepID=W9YMF4_9EURO|nr:uncharacterized protein A1O1_07067 [Capronia coronata CBS 617.96]EXJ83444.1 hypothetical protein A1O1_07067 [Capronia coronata CBS 617.96]